MNSISTGTPCVPQTSRRPLSGLMLLLALSLPAQAVASDAIVSAYANSQGSFTIIGNFLNRVAEAEIRVSYQSEEATLPQTRSLLDRKTTQLTSQGAQGSLYISFKCIGQPCKRPFSGYVPFAIADINGSINSLTALLRYENGTTESARVSITNPSPEQVKEKKEAEAAAEEARLTAAKQEKERLEAEKAQLAERTAEQKNSGQTGTVSDARRDEAKQQRSETAERATTPVTVETVVQGKSEPGTPGEGTFRKAVDAEIDQPKRFRRRESVLERFRSYDGENTPEALERLFDRSDDMFRQDPPVSLSDGASPLRLVIRISNSGEKAPLFYISEANCVNLHIGKNDGIWTLDLVPKRGSLAASVTVLAGNEMIDFPLTVAPPQEIYNEKELRSGEAEYVRTANRLFVRNMKK